MNAMIKLKKKKTNVPATIMRKRDHKNGLCVIFGTFRTNGIFYVKFKKM